MVRSLRSGREHKAWGGASAEPQDNEIEKPSLRSERQSEVASNAFAHSAGWQFFGQLPGVPFRSTPGFTLSPAPQAGTQALCDRSFTLRTRGLV